jgi:hypothetical protein
LGLDNAAEGIVQRVAYACGAVVGVVVVVVAGIFRAQVPQQEVAQRSSLWRRESEALTGDRASRLRVIRFLAHRGFGIHHVAHVATGEVEEEILLVEVEHAVVEIDRLP